MKKRIGAIVVLTLLTVMMTTSLCFAGTLGLEDSYPRDGDKGMAVDNSGVKLYFDQEMINKDNEVANSKCFKLTNQKGKEVPIRVLYSPKEKGLVLVLVDKQTLESDSAYKLTISGDVMATSGDTLGKDMTVSFNTVDTGSAMKANMVIMGLMMVGVIWVSSKAAKKKDEKDKDEDGNDKVNPYKVAKETGKSVKQIVEKDQKEKEKQRRKMEKKRAKEVVDDDHDEVVDNYNKRVKAPRPISIGGSTYITGRKAAAEEAARKKAQAGTTKPKKKSNKKK